MRIEPEHIHILDYTYNLPPDRIANFPLAERDQSKLLVYKEGIIQDTIFYQLPQNLPAGATLVLNDTRVIEARILFQKPTGAVIELFCLEPYEGVIEEAIRRTGEVRWKCMIGGASKWKPGQVLQKNIEINGEQVVLHAHYLLKEEDSFVIGFDWTPATYSFLEVVHAAGQIPLPPYIKRSVSAEDSERYQTVFGHNEGSVAAPTASLHFTNDVLERLKAKNIFPAYLTLHVGAGTFKPVKSETIGEHHMHSEPFTVSAAFIKQLLRSSTIVAVGTTSLRTLESLFWLGVKILREASPVLTLAQWEAYELMAAGSLPTPAEALRAILAYMEGKQLEKIYCQTSLLIAPGYSFQLPSALITNFHQPQSTLLLLIAAFVGEDWKKIYDHALADDYRFLSYGDSSLLWRS